MKIEYQYLLTAFLEILNLIHIHVEWSQGTIESIPKIINSNTTKQRQFHQSGDFIIHREFMYCLNLKKRFSDSND